ncbi:MAG: ribonuclease III [Bacillota bacterium]
MFQLSQERRRLLKELEARTGVYFNDEKLLNMALTHPTYVFEHRDVPHQHNQRLEFLGDAVVGMVVAEYLYKTYPKQPEGYLTKLRASLVCETALANYAKSHKIGAALLLGKGEEMSGGRERLSILADAYEAFVGAIYLDSGLDKAREFVIRDIMRFMSGEELWRHRDYKTLLQELVQKHYEANVTYNILQATGPDHDKRFVAGVFFKGRMLAEGKGKSKKEAEQEAARVAFEEFSRRFMS